MKKKISYTIALLMGCVLLASACGGTPAASAPAEPAAPAAESLRALPSGEEFVVGYDAGDDQNIDGLLKACAETKMECVRGKDIDELVQKGVDAIISFSNKWHVYGAWPQIQNAKAASIPIFMLNADSGEQGVYNLSTLHSSVRAGLEWMMEGMGGEGEFVYFNFAQNNYIQDNINEVLAANPNVKATSMPADYENQGFTQESIVEMLRNNPEIKAIWTSEYVMEIFWAAVQAEKESLPVPLVLCETNPDALNAWKEELALQHAVKAFAAIPAGNTDYEGVYAAYYHLAGLEFNQDALGGRFGNTFLYDYPILTSENLNEWMGKLDTLQDKKPMGYVLPAMTAEEIRAKWFVD